MSILKLVKSKMLGYYGSPFRLRKSHTHEDETSDETTDCVWNWCDGVSETTLRYIQF